MLKLRAGTNPRSNGRSLSSGLTLIEVLMVVAIAAVLMMIGIPSFRTWIQNGHVRNAAESIQNGLKVAKTEAVRRNTPIRFQFTSSLDNTCALTTTDSNWVVSFDNPTSLCAKPGLNEAYPPSDTTNNPAPRIIQRAVSNDGAKYAAANSGQSTFVFNALGRITPTPAANININITNPSGGTCVADGGSIKCLRIVVSPVGQIKLCDPSVSAPDARSC